MKPEKLMKSVELEREFRIASEEVNDTLIKISLYVGCIEKFYKNEKKNDDFVADMQMRQATLLCLINRLNDIAMQAMAINDQELVFKIEDVKRQVRDTMEVVRNLYM
jgi:hypothetical protein